MTPAGGLCLAYAVAVMESIHITDLEAAINYWRDRSPAGTGSALAPATTHLADPTLVVRPLVRPAIERRVALLQRPGPQRSEAAEQFAQHLRERLSGGSRG